MTLKDVYDTFPSGCTEDYKILRAFEMGKQTSDKKVRDLEAQIDKMMCCANCQTVRDAEGNCYLKKDGKCKDKDKWELRR